jgi:hypothetical protein
LWLQTFDVKFDELLLGGRILTFLNLNVSIKDLFIVGILMVKSEVVILLKFQLILEFLQPTRSKIVPYKPSLFQIAHTFKGSRPLGFQLCRERLAYDVIHITSGG